MIKFLEGSNIYLRQLDNSDLNSNYQNWFNDPDVCRFNSHHRFPNHEEDMVDYYNNVVRSKNNLVLAICNKKTDEHIGNISLQNIDLVDRSAEFAIVIGNKKFWGRGVGKEAGVLMVDHGFNALNLHRIYCGTSEDNSGMQKLADFLGFKKEGVMKEALFKEGRYKDLIHYGLLRKNWKKRK
jgi:ribosomal-protein-alanine N-acetyltransferase